MLVHIEQNKTRLVLLALAVGFLASFQNTVIGGAEWHHIESVREVLKRGYQFFKLDWSVLAALSDPVLQTVLMAFAGTALGVLIAVGIAGALRTDNPDRGTLRDYALKGLVVLSGSVHVVLWGLLFIWILGPGLISGILAITARSLGPIATYRVHESAKAATRGHDKPGGHFRDALRAVLRELTRNLGRAATLGLIGAGGIGFEFYQRLYTYDFGSAAMILLVIIALILASGALIPGAVAWPWRCHAGVDPAMPATLAFRASGSVASGFAAGCILALAVLVSGALLLATLKPIAGLPDVVPGPGAAALTPVSGAFLSGLIWSLSETIQMAVTAAVVGTGAAYVLYRAVSVKVAWLRHIVSATSRLTAMLALVVPIMFVAMLCRSVIGVGPLAGVIPLTFAAFGLVLQALLDTGATGRSHEAPADSNVGRHVVYRITDAFTEILPAAAVIGLVGVGGAGWYLKLHILHGNAAGAAAVIAALAALLIVSNLGSTALRLLSRPAQRIDRT